MNDLSVLKKAKNVKTGEVKFFASDKEVFNFCKNNSGWLSWRS